MPPAWTVGQDVRGAQKHQSMGVMKRESRVARAKGRASFGNPNVPWPSSRVRRKAELWVKEN